MRIGVYGFANSGKDTFADALVDSYGFTKIAFAEPLKDILLDVNPLLFMENGLPVHLTDVVGAIGWDDAKDLHPEIREYLVALGQSTREHLYPRIWLNKALAKAESLDRVVFSDVRQMNEATVLKETYGAVLVHVVRPGIGPANEDEENTLPPELFNFVVRNDGDLVDLKAKADLMMNRLGYRRSLADQGSDAIPNWIGAEL